MHFTPLLSLLGLAASASATIGASQMVSNIDQITQLSSSTADIAKSISVVNMFSTAPVCSTRLMMHPTKLTGGISLTSVQSFSK